MGRADFVSSKFSKTTLVPEDSKFKVNNSDGWGRETDEVEHLDVCLSQFTKASNKNQDTEETDVLPTSKQENRSPSPFDNQDTTLK